MMVYLRKVSSLKNFKSSSLGGQIATILILMMVAIIIFILVTVNIGNISIRATKVANAADAAVLYLGSIIATQAHYIYHALGDSYSYCVRGGYLAIVLAVIVAIICTIFSQVYVWYIIIPACAVAGAIGGYIATGTLKGAAMGALTGAAVGIAFYTGATAIKTLFINPSNTLTLLKAAAAIFKLALSSLTVPALVYNKRVADANSNLTLSRLNRQLNGLPDYEGTREGVFLFALNQAVDDTNNTGPNSKTTCSTESITGSNGIVSTCAGTKGDPLDLNGDGKTDDQITCFSYCWYNHIADMENTIVDYEDFITNFFDAYLIPFYENSLDFITDMDRTEIECLCGPGSESTMTELFRALGPAPTGCNYNIFWRPGPVKNGNRGLLHYYNCANNCAEPPGWDQYDATRMHYEDFIDYAKKILKPGDCGYYKYNAKSLSKKLRNRYNNPDPVSERQWDWFDFFYNPDSDSDYYDIFTGIASWVRDWRNSIVSIRNSLPGCQLSYSASPITVNKQQQVLPENTYCADKYPPVYPCNWVSTPNTITGPYFPNPVCKVYPSDKSMLNNEIVVVQNFVVNKTNLENWIRNQYYSNPCGFNCQLIPNPGAGPGAPLVEITVNSVRIDGTIHNKCSSAGLNPGSGKLQVNYNYRYTCSCCIPQVCTGSVITLPDGTKSYQCDCTCSGLPCTGCSSTCWPNFPDGTLNCTCDITAACCATVDTTYAQNNIILNIPIAAGDLETPWGSVDELLGILQDFQNTVNSVSDTFATIDADTEDEFQPILDKLQAQIDKINDFLPGLEQMYNDLSSRLDNRATNGAGWATYSWGDTECPKDSSGNYSACHSIKVESGPFKFPYTTTSWNNFLSLVTKKCINLKLGDDRIGKRTWIEITRTDPGERSLSSSALDLGFKWNPGQGNNINIKRKSKAYYTPTNVSIHAIHD